jgi:hypothetical protein
MLDGRRLLQAAGCLLFASTAHAANNLSVLEARLDRPTLIAMGVELLIADDDNRDARVDVRYRAQGETSYRDGLPLFRVRPEVVVGRTVAAQFSGAIFNLRPDTSYEIELHAVDPDGFDQTFPLSGRTRSVPRSEPTNPRIVNVSDAATLQAALDAAQPGDVITLAAGTYAGSFSLSAEGTLDNPIVIRGADASAAILDGQDCACNVLEVYSSFVHIESLTLRNAQRALRFQGVGAQQNVVRRIHIENVRLGIGAQDNQVDFYICDNVVEGRLAWPQVYGDDGGLHSSDDGILVMGEGHVVCHNRIRGFGDSIKMGQAGTRSFDAYGNESLSAYDNAVELDGSEGNTRAFANLFLNSWSPISFQPIYGGPAYAFRNVVVNLVDEQQKLHSLGTTEETVGAVLYNNTFVSAEHAVNLQTSATAHDFQLLNNLYVGPAAPVAGKTVDWSAPIDRGLIDYNGYFPDGIFDFNSAGTWPNFSALQTAGVFEAHGVLLTDATFASGLAAPSTYTASIASVDATLASGSNAVDRGLVLPGITDGYQGSAPDLGALELGCATPSYGPRAAGSDESNTSWGCEAPAPTDGGTASSGGTGGTGATGGSGGGDSGVSAGSGGSPAAGSGGSSPAASANGDEDSGCGCRVARTRVPSTAWLLGALLALCALRTTRRGS